MRYLIAVVMILIGCGSSSETATAREVNIYLVNVVGEYSLDIELAHYGWTYLKARYAEDTGVDLILKDYTEVDGTALGRWIYELENPGDKLDWCTRYHNDIPHTTNTIFYCLFPPIQHEGKRYQGGMAWSGTYRNKSYNVAMGQGQEWSSHTPPRPRLEMAFRIIAAHEIGHVFGANHIPEERCVTGLDGEEQCTYMGITIMHPAAGCYTDEYDSKLYFHPWSIDSIQSTAIGATRKYVRKLRRKAAKADTTKERRRINRKIKRVQTGKAMSVVTTHIDEVFE